MHFLNQYTTNMLCSYNGQCVNQKEMGYPRYTMDELQVIVLTERKYI
jgi:hypothetical protein